MRRVVVTGLGAVTPIGNNVKDTWDAAKSGRCGIDFITKYDTSNMKVKLAAEVKNFPVEEYFTPAEARKLDDYCLYAIASAKQAFSDAALDMEQVDSKRCGVIFSSGIGGLTTIQRETLRGEEKGYDRITPHFIPMVISNMAAGHIAIQCGFHGLCSSVVTACASGTNAIGDAFRQIKDGYQDVMICGGSEASINSLAIGGFSSMKALSTSTDPMRASIPFDAQRSGFVMGEGAGALVLEEYEHAVARNAHIYCEIAGYGVSCDAHHVTAPLEDGSMAARCMILAMDEAKVAPEEVTYVNAHGTSTKLNDKSETAAIKLALKEAADQVLVSSSKSMTGHLLGASGAVEAILTALCVSEDVVIPTINYQTPDPDCDLDVVPNKMRQVKVQAAISNSLGFGGHNASLVFRKLV